MSKAKCATSTIRIVKGPGIACPLGERARDTWPLHYFFQLLCGRDGRETGKMLADVSGSFAFAQRSIFQQRHSAGRRDISSSATGQNAIGQKTAVYHTQ